MVRPVLALPASRDRSDFAHYDRKEVAIFKLKYYPGNILLRRLFRYGCCLKYALESLKPRCTSLK